MSKARVKVKTKTSMPDGVDMTELNDVMNQMIGNSDPEPSYIYEKYGKVLYRLSCIRTAFANMAKTYKMVKVGSDEEYNELYNFADKLDKYVAEDHIRDIEKVKEQFESYNACITGPIVKEVVSIYDSLIPYNVHLDDPVKDYSFILRLPTGKLILPKEITGWDIKKMFKTVHKGEKFKIFTFSFLQDVYTHCKAVHDLATSPNVDPDKLSNVLMSALMAYEGKFPRHKLAFAEIKRHIGLLKKNMNLYYKEFLSSKDSSVFMHNFILDIAESGTTNPKARIQLRDLLLQIKKKIAATPINDPEIKKTLDGLSKSIPFLNDDKKDKMTDKEKKALEEALDDPEPES